MTSSNVEHQPHVGLVDGGGERGGIGGGGEWGGGVHSCLERDLKKVQSENSLVLPACKQPWPESHENAGMTALIRHVPSMCWSSQRS